MEQRDNGYYWVKWAGKWRVAYYVDEYESWQFAGLADYTDEFYIDEINETRILSPDEKTKS